MFKTKSQNSVHILITSFCHMNFISTNHKYCYEFIMNKVLLQGSLMYVPILAFNVTIL